MKVVIICGHHDSKQLANHVVFTMTTAITKDWPKKHCNRTEEQADYHTRLLFERPTSYVGVRSGLKSPNARSEAGPGFKFSS